MSRSFLILRASLIGNRRSAWGLARFLAQWRRLARKCDHGNDAGQDRFDFCQSNRLEEDLIEPGLHGQGSVSLVGMAGDGHDLSFERRPESGEIAQRDDSHPCQALPSRSTSGRAEIRSQRRVPTSRHRSHAPGFRVLQRAGQVCPHRLGRHRPREPEELSLSLA